jgi:hypothetical protein
MSFDERPLFAGTDRFRVIRRLGVGGMGEVYEVLDRERNARVALKKLKTPSPEALLRFKHEFRALEDIEHPNLVMLGELIEDAGEWFFTMELVEGVDFLDYVRPGTPHGGADSSEEMTLEMAVQAAEAVPPPVLPRRLDTQSGAGAYDERRLRSALAQLASAVHALHASGKVHRDIKPSNIVITDAGRLALLDLGLVTDIERDTMPARLGIAGTAAYMAPEQAASGVVGTEADWYSVGVLLFQALTGELPFEGEPLEVMAAKQERRAPAPSSIVSSVPPDLDMLCVDLLRMAPDERPKGNVVLRRLRAPAEGSHPSSSGMFAPPFVGRTLEQGLLRDALDAVRAGACVTVLVKGESGVGKSALVQRFTEQLVFAESEGVETPLVLSGRCHEREAVPYKAFDGVVDAIARFLSGWPRAHVEAVLPRWSGLLAQAFPVLRRVEAIASARRAASDPLEEREQRDRVFGALREMLTRLSERRPLVVAIDDLQWADADSFALLNEILRPPDPPAMLLVATVRTADADAPSGIELPGDVRRLRLAALPAPQAHELASMLVGSVHADVDVDTIAKEADGHPLFIGELVRYALAHPGQSLEQVPLEQALWSRIRQLDASVRRLLQLVTVAGVPLQQDVAARAAETRDFTEYSRWVSQLRTAHLVRTTGVRGSDTIEPYHDRVRAAVLMHLPDEVRSICHRRIAIALEGTAGADPEGLSVHWHGAGETEPAARHALEAARQAEEALAFDRAARLYRRSIDLSNPGGEERARLLRRIGDAVVNAGRGAEAAGVYLEAAESAHATETLELHQLAAAEYLRSGHITDGLRTLTLVLEPIGMRLAKTPRRALMSLLWTRAKLRLRGLGFVETSERHIPKERLIQIDACWSVGTGLALVDTVRAQDFQSRQFLMSLRIGEPYRVLRGLCVEAGYRSIGGGKTRRDVDALLERAAAMVDRVDDDRIRGFLQITTGIVHYLRGEWAASLGPLRTGEAIFRERCTGMSWELFNAQYYRLLTQFWTGEYAEFGRQVDRVRVWADDRGDLLAGTTLRNGLAALVPIVLDDPARAREDSRRVVERLPNAFQFQHYWQMLALATADLYEGNVVGARAEIEQRWRDVERAMLLRIQYIDAEARWLRARVWVSAATTDDGNREGLLREAETQARRIERHKMAYSTPMATLVRAGVANVRNDLAAAANYLAEADKQFRAADMRGFAAVARLHLGRMLGGEEGRRMTHEADAWLRAKSVVVPKKLAAVFAPGF